MNSKLLLALHDALDQLLGLTPNPAAARAALDAAREHAELLRAELAPAAPSSAPPEKVPSQPADPPVEIKKKK